MPVGIQIDPVRAIRNLCAAASCDSANEGHCQREASQDATDNETYKSKPKLRILHG